MIDTLYIEDSVREHPRTREITARFKHARIIECQRYQELFNARAQNFRLQKTKPALILAEKHGNTVLPTPDGYGVGSELNYYFSHMLNCVYDCRYCFLQGMYQSAHYVLFVNFESFFEGIENTLAHHPQKDVWFFSGYDCDSLALEPVTRFVDESLQFFQQHPKAQLELRTKSTQVRCLLKSKPLDNCVVAFSLSPDEIARALEHRAPPLVKRLDAMRQLQRAGWKIGLRFDPLIYDDNYRTLYADFFEQVFDKLDAGAVHSITLGTFRLPTKFFRKLETLYPKEKLLAARLAEKDGQVTYSGTLETDLLSYCHDHVSQRVPPSKIFTMGETDSAAA
ncbi:MAG: spore photoproduct lyase family protein [Pseudomonadota bacterium]